MNLQKIDALESGMKTNSTLIDAAKQAHDLATALRERGVEAYEFHDRHESVVTVGSFNSVGQPRSDGKIEINPGIHQIMQAYGAQRQQLPGQVQAAMLPQTVTVADAEGRQRRITFDVQPVPIKVPRASLAADYARRDFLR